MWWVVKGADLAVTRRPFAASLRSRTCPLSWHACHDLRWDRSVLQQLLARPFAARQSVVLKGHRCYCYCLGSTVVEAARTAAVVVEAGAGTDSRARHVVGSGQRQRAQVGFRLGSRAVAIGG